MASPDFEGTPEFLRPRLRLFLSADIVGSTALKQSRLGAFSEQNVKDRSSWFSIIQGFYIEARRSFIDEWIKTRDNADDQAGLFGEQPTLWKTIGDEVLFVKVLSDHRQLAITLKCWMTAVQHMKRFVKDRDSRLDIKCTAWTAGFPVKNKEVVLSAAAQDEPIGEIDDYYLESGKLLNAHYSADGASNIEIDFIGPSIDIGFRLAGFSTSRKFVIGVDIPYILALTSPRQDTLIDEFNVYYDGAFPLKGVFGGVNYPIFWLDMSSTDALAQFEDKLSSVAPPSRDHIRRYCDAFYREFSSYTFRPFIVSDTEQQLADLPPWYVEVHPNLVKNFGIADPARPNPEPQDEVQDNADVEEISRGIVEELAQSIPDASISEVDEGQEACLRHDPPLGE